MLANGEAPTTLHYQLIDVQVLITGKTSFAIGSWCPTRMRRSTVSRFLGIAEDQATTIPRDNARPFVEPGV
jgi:hypothetical protein